MRILPRLILRDSARRAIKSRSFSLEVSGTTRTAKTQPVPVVRPASLVWYGTEHDLIAGVSSVGEQGNGGTIADVEGDALEVWSELAREREKNLEGPALGPLAGLLFDNGGGSADDTFGVPVVELTGMCSNAGRSIVGAGGGTRREMDSVGVNGGESSDISCADVRSATSTPARIDAPWRTSPGRATRFGSTRKAPRPVNSEVRS